MSAYCEREDVRKVLQKTTQKFGTNQLGDDIVDAAIESVSDWFKRESQHHFYDSGGGTTLVETAAATASNLLLDVPSSPHRQDKQLFRTSRGSTKYPQTRAGGYVRVQLPRFDVESIDALEVREVDGEVTDWVADADFVEGKGEDYYLQLDEEYGIGRSYLYLNASSIGGRVDFDDLLTVECTYGIDYQDSAWDGVRRGIAALAGAQVITDDDVISQLPDNGSLIGVDTQVDQLVNIAMSEPGTLSEYLQVAVQ